MQIIRGCAEVELDMVRTFPCFWLDELIAVDKWTVF